MTRNVSITLDVAKGVPVTQVARVYRLSVPRIYQIVDDMRARVGATSETPREELGRLIANYARGWERSYLRHSPAAFYWEELVPNISKRQPKEYE